MTAREKLKALNLETEILLGVTNVLTSVDNLGGEAYSWEIRQDLMLKGAQIAKECFSDRLYNALYILTEGKIFKRNTSGKYQVFSS